MPNPSVNPRGELPHNPSAQVAARKFIELGVKGSIVMTSSMTSYRPNRVSWLDATLK